MPVFQLLMELNAFLYFLVNYALEIIVSEAEKGVILGSVEREFRHPSALLYMYSIRGIV